MVIPELIRLLLKKGIGMDDAINIVSKCAHIQNHTISHAAILQKNGRGGNFLEKACATPYASN